MSRPRIGVVGRRRPPGSAFPLEAAVAAASDYTDAVDRAGGVALVLTPTDPADAAEVLGHVDGLVIPGGPDVDPHRYGQEPLAEVYGVDELQDGFEAALIDAALAASVPLLCICRGTQLLNVCLGGTLHQHITGLPGWGPHGIPNGGGGSDNTIAIEAGSRLAGIVGAASMTGRCHHHQAIDRPGRGVAVVARTVDGGVEAIEVQGTSTVIAVQWHPEETASSDPDNQALFDALVSWASSRS